MFTRRCLCVCVHVAVVIVFFFLFPIVVTVLWFGWLSRLGIVSPAKRKNIAQREGEGEEKSFKRTAENTESLSFPLLLLLSINPPNKPREKLFLSLFSLARKNIRKGEKWNQTRSATHWRAPLSRLINVRRSNDACLDAWTWYTSRPERRTRPIEQTRTPDSAWIHRDQSRHRRQWITLQSHLYASIQFLSDTERSGASRTWTSSLPRTSRSCEHGAWCGTAQRWIPRRAEHLFTDSQRSHSRIVAIAIASLLFEAVVVADLREDVAQRSVETFLSTANRFCSCRTTVSRTISANPRRIQRRSSTLTTLECSARNASLAEQCRVENHQSGKID